MSEYGIGPSEFLNNEPIEFRPEAKQLLAELGISEEQNKQILNKVSLKFNLKENPTEFKGEYQDALDTQFPQSDELPIALMIATAELERIIGDNEAAENNLLDALYNAEYIAPQYVERIHNLIKD